jgi:4'-phosphopantetheinyl transferase
VNSTDSPDRSYQVESSRRIVAPREGPAVGYHACGVESVPDHDRWLDGPEAERLNRLVHVKRRSESRLGRWTAKHAVALTVGADREPPDLARIVIRNAVDGAPEVWRGGELAGTPISMTDRADWAVTVVATSPVSLGCDLELVETRSRLFVRDYFTSAEQAWVADRIDQHSLWANLIWSAKESALKVLREGLRRDTRSVEVCFDGEIAGPWRSFVVDDVDGDRFTGWWQQFGQFVLTVCADHPIDPPEALTDPSPLITAVPGHRWMEALPGQRRRMG